MRYLNGFILIGIALLVLGIVGAFPHSHLLTEPGQAVDPYAWLKYLAAAVLMLVNGAVSIWSARRTDQDADNKPDGAPPAQNQPAG